MSGGAKVVKTAKIHELSLKTGQIDSGTGLLNRVFESSGDFMLFIIKMLFEIIFTNFASGDQKK